jgi:hypothetical protein
VYLSVWWHRAPVDCFYQNLSILIIVGGLGSLAVFYLLLMTPFGSSWSR